MNTTNGTMQFLIDNQKDFLQFLKSRYKLYHLSNIFFRDLHYGVMAYLDWKYHRPGYSRAEELTKEVVQSLVSQNILKAIDRNAFLLNFPEFKKPPVKPAAPAKAPASAAKPAAIPRPAGPVAPKPEVQKGQAEENAEKKPEQPAEDPASS